MEFPILRSQASCSAVQPHSTVKPGATRQEKRLSSVTRCRQVRLLVSGMNLTQKKQQHTENINAKPNTTTATHCSWGHMNLHPGRRANRCGRHHDGHGDGHGAHLLHESWALRGRLAQLCCARGKAAVSCQAAVAAFHFSAPAFT